MNIDYFDKVLQLYSSCRHANAYKKMTLLSTADMEQLQNESTFDHLTSKMKVKVVENSAEIRRSNDPYRSLASRSDASIGKAVMEQGQNNEILKNVDIRSQRASRFWLNFGYET